MRKSFNIQELGLDFKNYTIKNPQKSAEIRVQKKTKMLLKQIQFIFLISSISLFSQIKGKVVDADNRPIPFVNIWVQNGNIGTTTEENGEFILSENNNNKNLIFSALGYEKQSIKATSNILVVLKSFLISLDSMYP